MDAIATNVKEVGVTEAKAMEEVDYAHLFSEYMVSAAEQMLHKVRQNQDFAWQPEQVSNGLHILEMTLASNAASPLALETVQMLAPQMEQAGHRLEWIRCLEYAVQRGQVLGDIAVVAELSLHIGYLCYLYSRFDIANEWLTKSKLFFEKIGNRSGQGRTLNRLAMVAIQQEDCHTAEGLAAVAHSLLDSTDPDLANSHFVLGEIAKHKRQWQEAEKYYRQSLRHWEQQDDLRKIGWGLRNLGLALCWQEKYEESLACFEKALFLLRKIRDPVNYAMTQLNLGIVYSKLGRVSKAIEQYRLAEKTFRDVHDEVNLARTYLNLGLDYSTLGRLKDAETACLASIRLWKRLKNIRALCNALDVLGNIYLEQNQLEKAITTFENALDNLTQIESLPSYQHLFEMLSRHLVSARKETAKN
ncbi:MAG: tetratricopeptide repeat protein [Chloroflexota bacterium]